MNGRHRKTYETIFAEPIRTSIEWSEVESLLVSFGADITNRGGSRVHFELNGVGATFHRPHPQKEVKKYVVRNLREFLNAAGIE